MLLALNIAPDECTQASMSHFADLAFKLCAVGNEFNVLERLNLLLLVSTFMKNPPARYLADIVANTSQPELESANLYWLQLRFRLRTKFKTVFFLGGGCHDPNDAPGSPSEWLNFNSCMMRHEFDITWLHQRPAWGEISGYLFCSLLVADTWTNRGALCAILSWLNEKKKTRGIHNSLEGCACSRHQKKDFVHCCTEYSLTFIRVSLMRARARRMKINRKYFIHMPLYQVTA